MTTNPFASPIDKSVSKNALATSLTQLQQADATTFNELAAKLLVTMLKSQKAWSNKDRPRIGADALLFRIHRHHGPLSASWVSASWADRLVKITPTVIQIDGRTIALKSATAPALTLT